MGDPIGDLQFELKKGIFYQSCLKALELVGYETFEACFEDTSDNRKTRFEKAKSNPSQQFALFIDEINRANISAVFGELITLLEDDKRMGSENELWVELPYSNEKFCVPANLYVIGTMNTADRSIALLDIALRRRFEFKALYPLYMEGEWWAPLLEDLNQAIYNWKKNPDFFIGHAFFINKSASEKLKILNTKIIPLLYEYGQNNAETVKRILTDAKIQIKASGIRENFQIVAV
jgi:5-methylcytosine-specific restriction protein B